MPDLKTIDSIKARLNSFGDEEDVLAKTGETIRNIIPDENIINPALSEIFEGLEDEINAGRGKHSADSDDDEDSIGSLDSINVDLDDLGIEGLNPLPDTDLPRPAPAAAETPFPEAPDTDLSEADLSVADFPEADLPEADETPAPVSAAPADEAADADLADLFGDETEAAPLSGLDSDDDFALSDDFLDSLGSDTADGASAVPETAEAAAPAPPMPEAENGEPPAADAGADTAAKNADFSDFSDLLNAGASDADFTADDFSLADDFTADDGAVAPNPPAETAAPPEAFAENTDTEAETSAEAAAENDSDGDPFADFADTLAADDLSFDEDFKTDDIFSELSSAAERNQANPALRGALDAFDTSGDDSDDLFELPELAEASETPPADDSVSAETFGDEALSLDSAAEPPPSFNEFELGMENADSPAIGKPSPSGGDSSDTLRSPLMASGQTEETHHFDLSETDFADLLLALKKYPRNLKIEVEDFLAGEANDDQIEILLSMLLNESSAHAVADYLEKSIGKKIKLPAKYKNLTGEALEHREQSFAYKFKRIYLPRILTALTVLFAVSLVVAAVFGILIPWGVSAHHYRQGKACIKARHYLSAEEEFNKAYFGFGSHRWPHQGLPSRKEAHDYAVLYEGDRQYRHAENKYLLLLADYSDKPKELKRTKLAYARLLSETLLRFEEAEKQLLELKAGGVAPITRIPFPGIGNDADADFALARNYFLWGNEDNDPDKYELALNQLKSYSVSGGNVNRSLYSLYNGWYESKTNQLTALSARIERNFADRSAAKRFLKSDKDLLVYNEMLSFFLDHEYTQSPVPRLLSALEKDHPLDPTLNWNRARWQRLSAMPDLESMTLKKVLNIVNNTPFLSKNEHRVQILAYNRLGEIHYQQQKIIPAKNNFLTAIRLYEPLADRKVLKPDPQFGILYSNLGNVYYYFAGNLDAAYIQYALAEQNHYHSDDLNYKQGFIDYWRGDYRNAKQEFYYVLEHKPNNTNAIIAMANALLQDNNLSHAQSHYTRYIESLNALLPGFQGEINFKRQDQITALQNLEMAYNNLGVTHFKQYQRNSNLRKRDQAMLMFTKSIEYYNLLGRKDRIRAGASIEGIRNYSIPATNSTASLNQHQILFNDETTHLQMFPEIPLDLQADLMADALDPSAFLISSNEILESLQSNLK